MNRDRETARQYRELAMAGDTQAMNNLCCCYHTGKGVAEDHAMALSWYMRAADEGDVYGMFNCAECYYHGDGVAQASPHSSATRIS